MLDEFRGKYSLSLIAYHIVWVPKYRRKVLVGKVRIVLEEILREKVEAMGWWNDCHGDHARPHTRVPAGGQ